MNDAWQCALRNETRIERSSGVVYANPHSPASAEVVRLVAEAAGSSVIYTTSPLERLVRETLEVLRHHGFTNEQRFGSVAQVMWDAPLDYPVLLR